MDNPPSLPAFKFPVVEMTKQPGTIFLLRTKRKEEFTNRKEMFVL